ncbi:MAG TPA: hypothetical protein VIZ17_13280 [Acetobacteraceae bacterium]
MLTDIMYFDTSTTASKLKSVDFAGASVPVAGFLATSTSTRSKTAIWSLAGGYTLAHDDWGNVDVIGGFRLLSISERTDFSLAADVVAPNGSIALNRFGGLSVSRDIWNGIVGVRGRVYIAQSNFLSGGRVFVPFYFDVGTGASDVTWQAFAGIGYQTKRLGLSIGYRYLSFEKGSAAIPHLALGGPIVAANLSF